MGGAESNRKDTRRATVVAEPVSCTRIFVVAVDPDHDVIVVEHAHDRRGADRGQIQRVNSLYLHTLAEFIDTAAR